MEYVGGGLGLIILLVVLDIHSRVAKILRLLEHK
jgi:hypothetical protein